MRLDSSSDEAGLFSEGGFEELYYALAAVVAVPGFGAGGSEDASG